MAKISEYPAGTPRPGDLFIIARAGDNLHIPLADMVIFPPGHLFGLTLSNNVADAVNDIDIAAGSARDSTDTWNLVLASAITKRLDAAWAVGTNQGGLDTGAIANTSYHVFLIMRSDTGVVDVLFSASATSPTLPTFYDYSRRIGSIVRSGGSIVGFVQDGDEFTLKVPVMDVNAVNPGTAAVTRTLSVPTGIRVKVKMAVMGVSTATGAGDFPAAIFISDLSITDSAASGAGVFSTMTYSVSAIGLTIGSMVEVYTNTSAQVRSRLEQSTANTSLRITTHGWIDTRGRFA